MGHKLTETQAKLWHLAEKEMDKIAKKFNWHMGGYMGGMAAITRNPDKSVRDLAKQEGTREWALFESYALAAPMNDEIMNDQYCQKLIDIIEGNN